MINNNTSSNQIITITVFILIITRKKYIGCFQTGRISNCRKQIPQKLDNRTSSQCNDAQIDFFIARLFHVFLHPRPLLQHFVETAPEELFVFGGEG